MKLISYRAGLALGTVLAFTTHAAPPPATAESPVPSLAPMVKKVGPTVVSIGTKGTIRERNNPLLEDPFFRQFFGDQPPRERKFQSAGSGVVVDAASGYIITNAHVIENATEITVTAQDDHEYKAQVVGADKGSDIAVLKLKEGKLPAAITLGDSSKLEVGDFVVAIGNPFGLQHTVTSGIVSALGRTPRLSRDSYEDFIQTDASINPGNSGGALVNLRGELVGINSAILSGGGGNIGIGFAIPVNMVKNVMDELIKYGEVKRGLLGVGIDTLTPDLVKAVGAPPDTQGALVSQVDRRLGCRQGRHQDQRCHHHGQWRRGKDRLGVAPCNRHATRRRQGRYRPVARRQATQGDSCHCRTRHRRSRLCRGDPPGVGRRAARRLRQR